MIIFIPGSLYSLYLVIFLSLFLTLFPSLLILSFLLIISLLFLFLTFTRVDAASPECPWVESWKYYSNFGRDNPPSLCQVGKCILADM